MSLEIEKLIISIIRDTTGNDDIVIDPDTDLIEAGLVDSVLMMEIITDIESRYGIEIDGDDITPDNFMTVASISNLVERYVG